MFEFQWFPPQTGLIKIIIPMTCQTNSTQRNRFVAEKKMEKKHDPDWEEHLFLTVHVQFFWYLKSRANCVQF